MSVCICFNYKKEERKKEKNYRSKVDIVREQTSQINLDLSAKKGMNSNVNRFQVEWLWDLF